MKNMTAVVILVVAAALVAFIALFERNTMTTGERSERKGRVFAEFQKDAVEALSVRGTAGEEIVVEKAAEDAALGEEEWRITAPRALRAEASAVRAVLSAIDFLIADRVVQGDKQREDPRFRLKAPRVQASFTIRGRTTAFAVGADAPQDKVYVAIDAVPDAVFAVGKEFLESLDKSLADLRDKRIVPDDVGQAESLVVARGDSRLELARAKEAPWRLREAGGEVLAASDQVAEVVGVLGDLKAATFVGDGVAPARLAEYGLAQAEVAVKVGLPGKTVEVLVGKPCPGEPDRRYATLAGSGTVACVDAGFLPVLERPARRYEETRLLVFRDDEVFGIALSAAGRTLELEKGEDGWKVAKRPDFAVEQEAVDELLKALRETRAQAVSVGEAAVSTLGGAEPAKISLALAGGGGKLELAVYPGAQAGSERVRRAGEAAVLEVASTVSDKARPDELAFRKRTIVSGDQYEVESVGIKGPTPQKIEKRDGDWRLVEPMAAAADGTAARELAGLLAEIKVKRFQAAKAGPEHGLAAPFAVVTARFAKEEAPDKGAETKDRTGTKEVILELGAPAGDGARYGRLRGADETVFVLGKEYEEAIAEPLVARDLFQVDDTEVAKLSLEAGDAKLVVELAGESWKAKDGRAVDGERLKRLLADLSGMKTVRALSFGKAAAELAAPTLVIQAWTKDDLAKGAPGKTATLGAKSPVSADDGYLARMGGADATFVLPARIIDDLVAFARGD